ncbi:MAG: metallophosphoesterase [Acidobacteriota bacterium]|jgi:hypothetical protein|nr:metallophosphoesterase [Acidobacteriota bacterium]
MESTGKFKETKGTNKIKGAKSIMSRRAWLKASALLPLLPLSTLVGADGKLIAAESSTVSAEQFATWRFAVFSDTQGNPGVGTVVNERVTQTMAEDALREKADFVLVSGDLVSGWFRNGGVGFTEQYAIWKKAMEPVLQNGIRIFPVRGNHDHGPERMVLPPLPAQHEPAPGDLERLETAYRAAVDAVNKDLPQNGPAGEKGLSYSFGHKNALIVGLDEYAQHEHLVSQEWLDAQLATAAGRHVFVYGHEPAFETIHRDNLAAFPEARDRFWDSLGAAGARTYFCGHDHIYNRGLIADSKGREIHQVISGTGGGSLKTWPGTYPDKRVRGEHHDEKHHGYLLVTVEGSKATVAWKALVARDDKTTSLEVLDSFAYDLAM